MSTWLRKTLVIIVIFVIASQNGSSASTTPEEDAQLGKIQSELQELVDEKLKSLDLEAKLLTDSKAPVEQQLKVLKQLSAFQRAFRRDADAEATDKRAIQLLKISKTHTRELIELSMFYMGSRAQMQTPTQEVECERAFQRLLKDVAGDDPCLQILVLTRLVALFPWCAAYRDRLAESLSKCIESDVASLKLRMNGYLWASGYVPINGISFQPKRADFMQKAFELAVQSADPYAISDFAHRTYENEALKQFRDPPEPELFLLVFQLLRIGRHQDGTQRFLVSSRLRNSLFASVASNDAASSIRVLAAWSDLLNIVPEDVLDWPDESGLEQAQCQSYLGALHLITGQYNEAVTCFEDSNRRADLILASGLMPLNLGTWRTDALSKMKRILDTNLDQDPWAMHAEPLQTINSYRIRNGSGFYRDFRVSYADEVRFQNECGVAAIALKKHNIQSAESLVAKLEMTTKSDKLHTPSHGLLLSSLWTSIGQEFVENKNFIEAYNCFDKAWMLANANRFPDDNEVQSKNFQRALGPARWPPVSVPPNMKYMNQAGVASLLQKSLPDDRQLSKSYYALLEEHPSMAGTPANANAIKSLLKKRIEIDKEKTARSVLDEALYELDTEENSIARLMETDPRAAKETLENVIDKRRRLENDKSPLVVSLCALGNIFIILGSFSEAKAAYGQAEEIALGLPATESMVKALPLKNLAKLQLSQEDYGSAEKTLSQVLAFTETEGHQRYLIADARTQLAQCLIEEHKFKEAQLVMAPVRGSLTEENARFNYSRRADIERLKALQALRQNEPGQAIKVLGTANELSKKSEDCDGVKFQDQMLSYLVSIEANLAVKNLNDASMILKDAELLVHKQRERPRFSEIQLLELKARLALAQDNKAEARVDYQKALSSLTDLSIANCPLAIRLKASMDKI